MTNPYSRQLFCSFFTLLLFAASSLNAADLDPVAITGRVEMRTVDCFNAEGHDHPPLYFVVDDTTNDQIELAGDAKLLATLRPDQRVTATGVPVFESYTKDTTNFTARALSRSSGTISQIVVEDIYKLRSHTYTKVYV